MQPLSKKKFTQPLGTKKKIMQPFVTKKILQPLCTKITMYPLRTKNHAPLGKNKITQSFGKKTHKISAQKPRNLSAQKKIIPPLGTKKNNATSRHTKNHAPSPHN